MFHHGHVDVELLVVAFCQEDPDEAEEKFEEKDDQPGDPDGQMGPREPPLPSVASLWVDTSQVVPSAIFIHFLDST